MQMTKVKGQINIETLVGFVIVLLVYVVGFAPIIVSTIQNATGLDPTTASLLSLVPAGIVIAIMVWIFSYATGRRPAGAWGGG